MGLSAKQLESVRDHNPCFYWTNFPCGHQTAKTWVREPDQIISSLDILLRSCKVQLLKKTRIALHFPHVRVLPVVARCTWGAALLSGCHHNRFHRWAQRQLDWVVLIICCYQRTGVTQLLILTLFKISVKHSKALKRACNHRYTSVPLTSRRQFESNGFKYVLESGPLFDKLLVVFVEILTLRKLHWHEVEWLFVQKCEGLSPSFLSLSELVQ